MGNSHKHETFNDFEATLGMYDILDNGEKEGRGGRGDKVFDPWILSDVTLVIFTAFWYDKMFQDNVHFMPQTWNELFFQKALVTFGA